MVKIYLPVFGVVLSILSSVIAEETIAAKPTVPDELIYAINQDFDTLGNVAKTLAQDGSTLDPYLDQFNYNLNALVEMMQIYSNASDMPAVELMKHLNKDTIYRLNQINHLLENPIQNSQLIDGLNDDIELNRKITELDSSTFVSDAISNVVWPISFAKICSYLSDLEVTLRTILEKVDHPFGRQCTTRQTQAIRSPTGCDNKNLITSLVTQAFWPVALQGLVDISLKLNGYGSCLIYVLLGVKEN